MTYGGLIPRPALRATPYRRGIAAGELYADAFIAWRDDAKASRDYTKPRPLAPACPYTHRSSVNGWQAGFKAGLSRRGVS